MLIISLFLFQSCDKKEVVDLNLEITVSNLEYKVNQDVEFLISGNPDQLAFYSGEDGHRYEHRNRTQAESKALNVEFYTNRRYGSDVQQPNSLRLLASQNFDNQYTASGVSEATWVDITTAFSLSPSQSDDVKYVSSGVVDLNSLKELGLNLDLNKQLYFAFKYNGSTGSTQPRWWLNQFTLTNITPDGQIIPLTTLENAAWVSVGFNSSPVSWIFNTNGLRFAGGGAAVGSNQVWAVSKGIALNSISPDKPIALKNMSTKIETYIYKFSKPGIYNVVFIGANTTAYGDSRSTKEFTLTINE